MQQKPSSLSCLREEKGRFSVINYLEKPPSVQELKDILKLLDCTPLEIMRTNEAIFKEKVSGKKLSDEALLMMMHEHPILIQRPILVKGNRAVIARSEEAINEILYDL